MAYFKGQGGRPKGAKNKSTDLHSKCQRLNVDVFEEMLAIAMATEKPQSRFNRFAKCAEYLYGRPKDSGEVVITPEMIREWMREQNAKPPGNEGAAG
jgi:hypothetical protein